MGKFFIIIFYCVLWIWPTCKFFTSGQATQNSTPAFFEYVDKDVETSQWYEDDLYEISSDPKIRNLIRYPANERRYGFTYSNQEPVVLSSEDHQLVPSAGKLLQIEKAPKRAFSRRDYQPLLSTGQNARHKFAEGLHIRWRHIGVSDEPFIAGLYTPTGWPLILGITFVLTIILVPITGAFLVQTGFILARFFQFVWGPLKAFLRSLLIRRQISNKWWENNIAPPHFLEPRISWKLPYFLRNDNLEDIPPELAYKPPINRIDYTMYILTEEDYDEMDLEMDEMEFVDDLLQFRDSSPHVVARLLRFLLGDDKFYYYFDEDILSGESEDEEDIKPEDTKNDEHDDDEDLSEDEDVFEYLHLLEINEPWMNDEYDKTFTGPAFHLEEIRKRRQMIKKAREEITYLHSLYTKDNMFDETYSTPKERKKAQLKAIKLMDRYARFSKVTKERIAEIEPSSKAQTQHNLILNKYLPLIDDMSHYNHRLNLKHEKQADPKRRKVQLDIFGGP